MCNHLNYVSPFLCIVCKNIFNICTYKIFRLYFGYISSLSYIHFNTHIHAVQCTYKCIYRFINIVFILGTLISTNINHYIIINNNGIHNTIYQILFAVYYNSNVSAYGWLRVCEWNNNNGLSVGNFRNLPP